MTDILDTLKAATAGKDGLDPVTITASQAYEIIGELAYLRQVAAKRRKETSLSPLDAMIRIT